MNEPDLIQTPNACTTIAQPPIFRPNEELLDIDTILSHATAELSMPSPDLAKARGSIDQARGKILNLAEGLEGSQKN